MCNSFLTPSGDASLFWKVREMNKRKGKTGGHSRATELLDGLNEAGGTTCVFTLNIRHGAFQCSLEIFNAPGMIFLNWIYVMHIALSPECLFVP